MSTSRSHIDPPRVSNMFAGCVFYLKGEEDQRHVGLMTRIKRHGGRLRWTPDYREVTHILVTQKDPTLRGYTVNDSELAATNQGDDKWRIKRMLCRYGRILDADGCQVSSPTRHVLAMEWVTACIDAGRISNLRPYELYVRQTYRPDDSLLSGMSTPAPPPSMPSNSVVGSSPAASTSGREHVRTESQRSRDGSHPAPYAGTPQQRSPGLAQTDSPGDLPRPSLPAGNIQRQISTAWAPRSRAQQHYDPNRDPRTRKSSASPSTGSASAGLTQHGTPRHEPAPFDTSRPWHTYQTGGQDLFAPPIPLAKPAASPLSTEDISSRADSQMTSQLTAATDDRNDDKIRLGTMIDPAAPSGSTGPTLAPVPAVIATARSIPASNHGSMQDPDRSPSVRSIIPTSHQADQSQPSEQNEHVDHETIQVKASPPPSPRLSVQPAATGTAVESASHIEETSQALSVPSSRSASRPAAAQIITSAELSRHQMSSQISKTVHKPAKTQASSQASSVVGLPLRVPPLQPSGAGVAGSSSSNTHSMAAGPEKKRKSLYSTMLDEPRKAKRSGHSTPTMRRPSASHASGGPGPSTSARHISKVGHAGSSGRRDIEQRSSASRRDPSTPSIPAGRSLPTPQTTPVLGPSGFFMTDFDMPYTFHVLIDEPLARKISLLIQTLGKGEIVPPEQAQYLVLALKPGVVIPRDKHQRTARAVTEGRKSKWAVSHKWIERCCDEGKMVDPRPWQITFDQHPPTSQPPTPATSVGTSRRGTYALNPVEIISVDSDNDIDEEQLVPTNLLETDLKVDEDFSSIPMSDPPFVGDIEGRHSEYGVDTARQSEADSWSGDSEDDDHEGDQLDSDEPTDSKPTAAPQKLQQLQRSEGTSTVSSTPRKKKQTRHRVMPEDRDDYEWIQERLIAWERSLNGRRGAIFTFVRDRLPEERSTARGVTWDTFYRQYKEMILRDVPVLMRFTKGP